MLRGFVLVLTLFCSSTPILNAQSTASTESTWTLAAVGDVIMNRRLAPFDRPGDPGFHDLANLIRGADVAFMNLEQSVFRMQEFAGWPAAESGGGYTVASPEMMGDLVAMGFDLFNRANNHTTDYGVAGMQATNRLLDSWGLAHAGSGNDLGWASRPAYLGTPKGRVALIGMASTFTAMSAAGPPALSIGGRPGLNALRLIYRNEATPPTMDALRNAARAQGVAVSDNPGDSVRVFRTVFYPGERDQVVEILPDADRVRVLSQTRNAANQANYVILNSHTHEPTNRDTSPPPWLVEFTHQAIDAGATAFIVEGPHQLRGIEIYNGRPIFYSLGNFVFHNETIDPLPADVNYRWEQPLDSLARSVYDVRFAVDAEGRSTRGFPSEDRWYESVLVVAEFEGQEVTELRLHPIDLAREAPRSERGTPRVASPEKGRAIIERLAELSRPFDTTILYEDGIGVWRR